MRLTLADPQSCQLTFQGVERETTPNVITELIKSIPLNKDFDLGNNPEKEVPVFPIFSSSGKGHGVHNSVKIISYHLEKSQDLQNDPQAFSLIIHFDKGLSDSNRSKVTQKINLFSQQNTTLIGRCSTFRPRVFQESWKQAENGLVYQEGSIGIGSNAPVSPLTISGDIKIGFLNQDCASELQGTLRFNQALSSLEICHGTGQWTLINTEVSNE